MELEFSRQIFEKYWNIKFNDNPWGGKGGVLFRADGQTGRHEEDDSRFPQFC